MIIYFSGNGNSEFVARKLSESLADKSVVRIDEELIRNSRLQTEVEDERVVWVVPVHAWGLPVAVHNFMEEVNVSNKILPHYLVVTCGDDTGYVDKEWKKLMKRAGVVARGCWHVIMPNTFVTLPGFDVDDEATAKSKLEASKSRIAHISDAIKAGSTETDLYRGKSAVDVWVKSYVLRPLFKWFCMSPRWFHATSECNSCGTCVRTCPLKNIELGGDGRPVWGQDCTFCLGCYNRCPKHAVRYGKATDSKGQYKSL